VFASGCSSDDKATPQAIFDGHLELASLPDCKTGPNDPPGCIDKAGGEKNCGEAGGLFTLGAFGNPAFDPPVPSEPKKDGDSEQQGSVGVQCSVTAAGDNTFNVSASLQLTGATGGTFVIRQSKVSTTDGATSGVSGTFSKRGGAGLVYNQNDGGCTIRFTTPFQGVAAGRIWGQIECPRVSNSGAQVVCKAIADFRFENCDQ
jgi:hypothetical protein